MNISDGNTHAMKKRNLLKQLLKSTARTGAAIDGALEYVEASEKRMHDTESSHITPTGGNVLADLWLDPTKAEALNAESQRQISLPKGAFEVPDGIDEANGEIAKMFTSPQHCEADDVPLSDEGIASGRKFVEPMLPKGEVRSQLPVTALNGMIQRPRRKAMRPKYKLSDLLAQMVPSAEVPDDLKVWADMKPVGKEIWWRHETRNFRQARARYLKRRRGA